MEFKENVMTAPVAATVDEDKSVLIGETEEGPVRLLLSRANRHGLVAGQTGTGKTVTLTTLAYGLVKNGVTVFAPDVKGDLAGMISKLTPTRMWDLAGERGDPIRVSVRDMGLMMFSRVLDATEAQERVLTTLFVIARREGKAFDTLQNVREVLQAVTNDPELQRAYGNVSQKAAEVIMGKLLVLEENGSGEFFGPTTFDLGEVVESGLVNVLRAETLHSHPSLYSTFLFWLLNELFAKLPEVGDADKPKLVFFFDEAHLLFKNASPAFRDKVEQVVRLIRSKGVGVYFVTQSPADLPDAIMAQLGNRIQHALRGWTPTEQRGVKAAAQSFRPNPKFDTAEAIETLEVGEALVSVLDSKGVPCKVQRTKIAMIDIPANAREQVVRKAVAERPKLTVAVDNTKPVREEPVAETPVETVEPVASEPLALPVVQDVPAEPVATTVRSVQEVPVMSPGSAPLIGSITMRDINFNLNAPTPVSDEPIVLRLEVTKPKRKPLRLWLLPVFVAATGGWWFASAFVGM